MATSETQAYPITPTPYPAKTTTTTLLLPPHSIPTTITLTSFSDKLLLTVSQHGRLVHWLHIPLSLDSPTSTIPPADNFDSSGDPDQSHTLLPHPHLTATTILGGTGVPDLAILGQTLGTQIASLIVSRNERESRLLVMGLGLDPKMAGRDEYAELVGAVMGLL
ncbi:hypothetical protein M011DRAFT_411337 [Sporormia fimetaria CBS 119925]|uniref:Proteasome assembly chaperone 3 n=1 Tax=Sporormia fimetaria CBS 119925 TaxID=1340428 RepID=A0A6A6UXX4_9PLEO|nr:hypothetical protein M011DRAFT_411337 [Sporormia fimetaria CBS 119925]